MHKLVEMRLGRTRSHFMKTRFNWHVFSSRVSIFFGSWSLHKIKKIKKTPCPVYMETALLEASIKQLKGWVIDFLACASTHSSLFPRKGSVWQSCWNSSVRAQTVKASVLRFLWRLLWIVTGTKTHPSCSIPPIPSQLLVISSVRCGLRQSTLPAH